MSPEMHRADGIVCRLRSPNSKKVPEEWLNPGGTIGPRNYNPPDSHTLTHAQTLAPTKIAQLTTHLLHMYVPSLSASLHLWTHKQGIATGMRFTQQKKLSFRPCGPHDLRRDFTPAFEFQFVFSLPW